MAPSLKRLAACAAGGVLVSLQPSHGLRTLSEQMRTGRQDWDEATIRRNLEATQGIDPSKTPKQSTSTNATDFVPNLTWIMNRLKKAAGGGGSCYEFDPPQKIKSCKITEDETCSLESLRENGKSTLVYPGGKTRCLNNEQPDYAFQVFPGDADKLYLFFDGGGAEWDAVSTAVALANKTEVIALKDSGLLKRGEGSQSPFQNHTIIVVQYCSGDLHVGSAVPRFSGIDKKPVVMAGYHNTMSAVQWAHRNLARRLKSFAISGISAGAIGTELWSYNLLKTFQYESARVFADSYVPVFPENFQGKVWDTYGACWTDMLRHQKDLQRDCTAGVLDVQKVFESAMEGFPQVGFASITSARDGVQTSFWRVAAATQGDLPKALGYNAEKFQEAACTTIEAYETHPNYVSYMLDGSLHILQNCRHVYDHTQSGVKLVDWLNDFLASKSAKSVSGSSSLSSCRKMKQSKTMTLS